MDSVKTPYDQCIKTLLENIKLDPFFAEFYAWARENNVPVVVLSSGMEPIIKALLVHLVGETAEHSQIVSNDVEGRDGTDINSEGGWKIVFHDQRYVFLWLWGFGTEDIADVGFVVISAMTSLLRLDSTLNSQNRNARPCFMLEMESRI